MSGPSSGSLDDLFLATSASSPNFLAGEKKRRSAYTEAFIDTITAPEAGKIAMQERQRVRRVSAPANNAYRKSVSSGNASLDQVFEEEVEMSAVMSPVSIDTTMPMSYSADDLKQLQEDADAIGPSKWKKFGIAAGYAGSLVIVCMYMPQQTHFAYLRFICLLPSLSLSLSLPLSLSLSLSLSLPPSLLHSFIGGVISPTQKDFTADQSHLLGAPNGGIHPSRSMSHDLKDQAKDILQVPTFGLGTSPKTGAYEFESISQRPGGNAKLLMAESSESVHSTSSQ